ncbi:MAG: hypothetical protein ABEK59_01650 [Halobacteria archaeon]
MTKWSALTLIVVATLTLSGCTSGGAGFSFNKNEAVEQAADRMENSGFNVTVADNKTVSDSGGIEGKKVTVDGVKVKLAKANYNSEIEDSYLENRKHVTFVIDGSVMVEVFNNNRTFGWKIVDAIAPDAENRDVKVHNSSDG